MLVRSTDGSPIAAPFRLAVVGCGKVFERYHLKAVRSRPGVRIVAAVEPESGRLEWVKRALPRALCRATLDDVLKEAVPDGVLVATPPEAHVEVAERCLEEGLAVLVEKPMAVDVLGARTLMEAQRRSGRPLLVGFNRRFYEPYRPLRRPLREASSEAELEYVFVAEQSRWSQGHGAVPTGSVLHDIGCHALDLVRFLGDSPVETLQAKVAEGLRGEELHELHVQTASGLRARCVVGYGPSYTERLEVRAANGTHRVTVAGGGSAARVAQTIGYALQRVTGRSTVADSAFGAQLDAFVAACAGHAPVDAAGPSAGLAAVEGIRAANESLQGGGIWCPVTRLKSEQSK
ncbi:MAG: Gfo/Idh/MocA family oxidoreductase [Gemmatimonadota bacterium]|nr:Gfo/Idh/MocA family oxidoreductase [Gemmatimonadota bacterium]